jgi:hypothetical protein
MCCDDSHSLLIDREDRMDGDCIDTDIWSGIRNMLHYTLYLEFELNGLAISFTTLDHRLELFI